MASSVNDNFTKRCRLSAFACAIAATVLSADFAFVNQSARAQVLELTCTGSQTTTYSPGLQLTPQPTNLTIQGAATTCTSLTDSSVKSGTYTATGQVTNSCLLSSPTPAFDLTINWNNGQSSTISFTSNTVLSPLATTQVVSTGQVTSGLFQGAMATSSVTVVTPQATQCLSPGGVTTLSGPLVLTLTRV
ncbi:MAG: hypothetical protein KME31_18125 [Tolypothrix carrinoi HA7290-LM1]|jgi:hypothetical protein|nr:hypothetical protein [Tolypothrix carrinoi HA7290-LM1]